MFYLITTGGISIKVDDVYRNARARCGHGARRQKHLICGVGQSDIPSIDIAPLLSNQTVETIHLGNPAIHSKGDEPAQTTEMVAIVVPLRSRDYAPVTQRFTKNFARKRIKR